MGHDLQFRACIQARGKSAAVHAIELFRRSASYNLHFGGYYWDEASKDDPPLVFSAGDKSKWTADFENALRACERQGWGRVGFVFDLLSGESWGLQITVNRHPESANGKWILVTIDLKLSRLDQEEEMAAFLQSVLVPLVRDLRPDILVGDVVEYSLYLPSVPELEQGVPSDVCWVNVFGPSILHSIGQERITALANFPSFRVSSIDGSHKMILLGSLPVWDPRAFARDVLRLSPRG